MDTTTTYATHDGPEPRPSPVFTHTAVVHDGNGTWFTPGSLRVCALTDDELDLLNSGEESVLADLPAVNLLEILPAEFDDEPWIQWE